MITRLNYRYGHCLGIAPRTKLLKKSAWLLYLIGDKVPPTARKISSVVTTLWSAHLKRQAPMVWEQLTVAVNRIVYPGWSHGCYPVLLTYLYLRRHSPGAGWAGITNRVDHVSDGGIPGSAVLCGPVIRSAPQRAHYQVSLTILMSLNNLSQT